MTTAAFSHDQLKELVRRALELGTIAVEDFGHGALVVHWQPPPEPLHEAVGYRDNPRARPEAEEALPPTPPWWRRWFRR